MTSARDAPYSKGDAYVVSGHVQLHHYEEEEGETEIYIRRDERRK